LKNIYQNTDDITASNEMKRKMGEQSSFAISYRNQEELIRPTPIKKFQMGKEDDFVFYGDDNEDEKEKNQVDLFSNLFIE
jgi:hypothetical protein